jgi:hypothetical protein
LSITPGLTPSPWNYVRRGEEIVLMGFLDGATAEWNLGELMLSLSVELLDES